MNNQAQADVKRLVVTIGEHWKKQVLAQVRRRRPQRKWQQFVAEVSARNLSIQGRSTLLADVAARQKTLDPSLPELGDRFGVPGAPGVQPPSGLGVEDILARPSWPVVPASRFARQPNDRFAQQGDAAADGLPNTDAEISNHPVGLRAGQPDRAVEPGVAEALAGVAHTLPARLDAHTQRQLSMLLDIRIPAVKLYANQAADAVARRYRADAVSIGDKILFRAGKFDPSSPAGLGLLGHELTHAAQARLEENDAPGEFPRADREHQELAALGNEARVLHHLTALPAAGGPLRAPMPALAAPGRVEQPANPGSTQPLVQSRLAASDRPMAMTGNAEASPLLSERQLQQIKDVVYRHIIEQVRIDSERGG